MTSGDALTAAVQATEMLLAARAERDAAEAALREAPARVRQARLTQRQAVYDLYWAEGRSSTEIEQALRGMLLAQGHTPDELRYSGISHDTIEKITGTRAHPKPRPE